MAVFNNNPPGKTPRIHLGYGTAERARRTIKRLRREPRSYQLQAARTMYYRAAYHKHQTEGMRSAMKLYRIFLATLKRKRTI